MGGVALLTIIASSSRASGQVAHDFGEVQTRLQRGELVVIVDGAGRPTRGTVTDLSTSSLQLLIDGERRTFDEAQVKRIDRLVRDSVKNGALWGLAVGAGAGFLGIVAAGRSGASFDSAGAIVALGLIGGPAAGAAVGAAVDASEMTRESVYVRGAPTSARVGFSLGMHGGHVSAAVHVRF
jgi:hypothetical protein